MSDYHSDLFYRGAVNLHRAGCHGQAAKSNSWGDLALHDVFSVPAFDSYKLYIACGWEKRWLIRCVVPGSSAEKKRLDAAVITRSET